MNLLAANLRHGAMRAASIADLLEETSRGLSLLVGIEKILEEI